MTALGQKALIQHLTEVEALEVIAREGLDPEHVPTEALRPVVEWCLGYYYDSGREKAPSLAVMIQEFGDLLADHEIDIETEPEDSIEWAIKDLKATWVSRQVTDFLKGFATDNAKAPTEIDRVAVAVERSAELLQIVTSVTPRSQVVDAHEGLPERLLAYHSRAADTGKVYGMALGLPEVDQFTGGIHPGELAILAAPPKTGKAQPLDAGVLTPTGWVRMGDLRVGDSVVGADGRPTEVIAVHPQGLVPIYRVIVNDGSSVEACGDHLWRVRQHHAGWRVVATSRMREDLLNGRKRAFILPMVAPVHFAPEEPMPLDPYLLGVLLGDGGMTQRSVTVTTADPEILDAISPVLPEGVGVVGRGRYQWCLAGRKGRKNPVTTVLRDLGLMGCRGDDKFIPEGYLRAAVRDRFALLQGLLDTDGGVEGRRSITFCTTSSRLAAGVRELVEGLGGVCRVTSKETGYRPAWKLCLRIPEGLGVPFRLPRKARLALPPVARARGPHREVVAVEYVGLREAQCITVAAPDALYVTEHALVTHNSYFLARSALREWQRGRHTALFSLENRNPMTLDRLACLLTAVDAQDWQLGRCDEGDIEMVTRMLSELDSYDHKLTIFRPAPGRKSVEQMVRTAQAYGADSILIDQLTWVDLPGTDRWSKTQRIGEALHNLTELISTGHSIPCLMAHQINREGVKAAEKAGNLEMYHMAESAEIERTADVVYGLYQNKEQRHETKEANLSILAARRHDLNCWEMKWDVASASIFVMGVLDVQ